MTNNNTESQFSKEAEKEGINRVNETLAQLTGSSMKVNELFRDHAEQYVAKPKSMTMPELVHQGTKVIEAESQVVDFVKKFKARPDDGAVAFAQVLTQTYGMGAIGKTIHSFFGSQRPEYKTVTIGFDAQGIAQTVEVPWGLMEFGPLSAEFQIMHDTDPDYGHCFAVSVSAPKKNQAAINGLFMLVEQYLKENSIYKNKALHGVGRADRNTGEIVEPKFEDVYTLNRDDIVYTEKVTRALEGSVFGIIQNTGLVREDPVAAVGQKILMHGPNGSGKTAAAILAEQYAIENGWTAIRARYDEDLAKVVAFAERVGTPVVVVVEDVEKLMDSAAQDSKQMDKLLELFDGAGAKGREVMLIMTSNHVNELTKSMTRAGRIDRMIEISSLDRESFERLVNVLVGPERYAEEIDFDVLYDAFPECAPVWIVEAIRRARVAALIRTGEHGSKFVTRDFLLEAEGLAEHIDVHQSATDRPQSEAFGDLFRDMVKGAVGETLVNYRLDQTRDLAIVEMENA